MSLHSMNLTILSYKIDVIILFTEEDWLVFFAVVSFIVVVDMLLLLWDK